MSVPYEIIKQKEEATEHLLVGTSGQLKASQKVPLIARAHVSERALKTLDIVGIRLALNSRTYTDVCNARLNDSSRRSVFPPMPSSANK